MVQFKNPYNSNVINNQTIKITNFTPLFAQ